MNSHNTQGPMTLFRVYTEDMDRSQLRGMLRTHGFFSASIFYGEGLWETKREAAAVIEIVGHEALRGEITELAHDIKKTFNQDAVLVVEINDRVQAYNV